MTNRRTKLLVFAAAAFISLMLPVSASAQRPWWDRGNRDDDRYDNRYGHISDAERRRLRDLARRIDDRSRSFQRNIDRALDDSRYDDTRREDRINEQVADFRNAASRFRNNAGDSNDLNRSRDEARQLINLGARIDRVVGRARLDSRAYGDWSQIRADLRTVAQIYRLNTREFGDYRRDDDYDRNPRRPRTWPF